MRVRRDAHKSNESTDRGFPWGGSVFRRIAEAQNNIIHWSNRESGSHMVAMADPESLIEDIRAFLASLPDRTSITNTI